VCLYIRKNKLAPKLVSHELGQLGFRKEVVSKINRVAFASDELFSRFQAKMIGFDRVLMLARAEGPAGGDKATPAAKALHECGALSTDDLTESEKAEAIPSTRSASKSATPLMRIESAVAAIMKQMSSLTPNAQSKFNPKVFSVGPTTVSITFDKNWKSAPVATASSK
jgi:hypothetical protein